MLVKTLISKFILQSGRFELVKSYSQPEFNAILTRASTLNKNSAYQNRHFNTLSMQMTGYSFRTSMSTIKFIFISII
jgi:hypothetical protein